MTSFYTWLKQQKHRDDPVGDLAKDTKSGLKPENTLEWWGIHLMYHNASREALLALRDAWKEYNS